MPSKTISIIVPAYNEAESLRELSQRIAKVMDEAEKRYELWIVDDGSRDGTRELVKELAADNPSIGYVRQRINSGKSMALMQGYAVSRGDVVVTMDADLQDEPEDIPKLLAALEEGFDLAGGWRHERQDPFAKRMVSRVFNFLVHRISGKEFKDINCGFKAYTREVADHLDLTGDMHRLIPAIAETFGFKTAEVPISHKPRKHGQSKYRLLRYRGLLDLISFTVLRTTQVRSFHVMCEIGFYCILSCIALTIAVWALGFLPEGLLRYFFRSVFAGLTIFTGALGIIAPIAGLIVESVVIGRQNGEWRTSFIGGKFAPESTNPTFSKSETEDSDE